MKNKVISIFIVACCIFGITSVGFNLSADSTEVAKLEITLIPIDFSDKPHFREIDSVADDIYSSEIESAHRFWNLASSGKQEIVPGEFTINEWYRPPKKLSYYAKDTEKRADVNAKELIKWAFDKAVSEGLIIDKEDGNKSPWGDEYFMLNSPTFCFVVAGEAEGYTNYPRDDAFWPHKHWLNVSDEDDERKIMLPYILVTEDMSYYGHGSKVIAHEIGHLLTLADLYDYHCGGPYKGTCKYPFTYYDIMVARHGGQGLTGLHREMLGWIESETISGIGTYELAIPPITTNTKGAYQKIQLEGTNEFIGVEYRKKVGVDAFWEGIPAEGVILYRVNEDTWYGNNTDWQETGEQYARLFNPRNTKWHDNPCYTSTDISTAIIKAEKSADPLNKTHSNILKITILSEDENGAKLRVNIEKPEDKLEMVLPAELRVGHLHDRIINVRLTNPMDRELTITSEYLSQEIILPPLEEKIVTMDIRLPEYNKINETFEIKISVETNDTIFFDYISLSNILPELDTNNNGQIEIIEIDGIFDMLGEKVEDHVFDVDENGIINFDDVIIIAKYVGLEYR